MTAHVLYGAWFLVLKSIDMCFFSWHGMRPIVWTRQLVAHRWRAPNSGDFQSGGTLKERQLLEKAQELYPDRHLYLGAGSEYSPWYGERWGHYVKVLVTDGTGAPPPNKYRGGGCYGMPIELFKQTEYGKVVAGNKT